MATKYVSSLTGEEMDAALIDMAYHNSEAYAVGTRNGVAVGSSDVTYHNNSKYWAEQVYGYTDRAEDAANRAEAAVPSGTAGAVFFDRAQSLSDAQQAQARANIMAGGSNPNLLDNPWWGSGEAINQRNFSTDTSNSYTIDRWTRSNGDNTGTITLTADGLQFIPSSSGAIDFRSRYLLDAFAKPKSGETFTISLLMSDGTIFSSQMVILGSGLDSNLYFTYNSKTIRINCYTTATLFVFRMLMYGECTIRAVKLELGSVSTLANDAPPNYAEELEKCKYYYREVALTSAYSMGIGFAYSNTGSVFPNIFGYGKAMRTTPTVTMSGSFTLRNSSNTSLSVTAIYANGGSTGVFSIDVIVASGLTAGSICRLVGDSGAKLMFSADL